MHAHSISRRRTQAGLTLAELLVVVGVMGLLAYTTAMIYSSVLNIYEQQAWKLPPYDAATAAVQRVSHDLRDAMVINSHADDAIVIIVPQKDANQDPILMQGADNQYHLVQGDSLAIYLSDRTGALAASGHCLWEAIKHPGEDEFTPKVMIAENIDPDLNPKDPSTEAPRPMFTYWPDSTHLWGVEMWMTSTTVVHGKTMAQTAHSESYLRNL